MPRLRKVHLRLLGVILKPHFNSILSNNLKIVIMFWLIWREPSKFIKYFFFDVQYVLQLFVRFFRFDSQGCIFYFILKIYACRTAEWRRQSLSNKDPRWACFVKHNLRFQLMGQFGSLSRGVAFLVCTFFNILSFI